MAVLSANVHIVCVVPHIIARSLPAAVESGRELQMTCACLDLGGMTPCKNKSYIFLNLKGCAGHTDCSR